MNIKEFMSKYGTQTASLLMERVAREIPGDTQEAAILVEIARDLRGALQAEAEKR